VLTILDYDPEYSNYLIFIEVYNGAIWSNSTETGYLIS